MKTVKLNEKRINNQTQKQMEYLAIVKNDKDKEFRISIQKELVKDDIFEHENKKFKVNNVIQTSDRTKIEVHEMNTGRYTIA